MTTKEEDLVIEKKISPGREINVFWGKKVIIIADGGGKNKVRQTTTEVLEFTHPARKCYMSLGWGSPCCRDEIILM